MDVDPWDFNLSDVRAYMITKARDLTSRNSWIWVFSEENILKQLWSQLGVRVERETKTGLVAHLAKFIIIDENGYIRYHVEPRSWDNPILIANKLVEVIKKIFGKILQQGVKA